MTFHFALTIIRNAANVTLLQFLFLQGDIRFKLYYSFWSYL